MRISIGKNISRIYKELIFEKQYLYLYRTIIVQKNILGIIEIEFIENLYNTGLTDQKTILYKYWKKHYLYFYRTKNCTKEYLE